jgi:hypothetical protein
MCFAIDKLQETIINFDRYELEPPYKHIYQKDYSHLNKSILRIVIDENKGRLEIMSIHFKEKRKDQI